ncbi:hypothetical protein V9T40_004181 [Parthenolecanium corni]|uniref:Uncharacterized protein n=1 Tax=Parthenolecanium corni TaxID=536013 RepID=A0AAN9U348_9HEMI
MSRYMTCSRTHRFPSTIPSNTHKDTGGSGQLPTAVSQCL